MQKRAPTLGNMLVIVLFALSCFGLLLFLWSLFGGPLPLKLKGYRFTVTFRSRWRSPNTPTFRISGVDIGHVVALKLGDDGRTHATIEVAGKYAPIHANMHAILRQKTLLGETYVQLIPESPRNAGPPARRRPPAYSQDETVGHPRWDPLGAGSQDAPGLPAVAAVRRRRIDGRGEQINAASLASLDPFAGTCPHADGRSACLPGKGPCGRSCTTRVWCSTPWPAAITSWKG